ncbi:hypothetical protein M9Y10_010540 [Tritrichomonas musculus]|uniref:SecA family profile domain-containing protein n=1 Tax=Tritrichomonas musculus TaxID=1915356 RepID=A0ABR2IL12_9EUKA
MPILDPTEAYYLIDNSYKIKKLKKLFTSFLPQASENIFLNINTVTIYEQFTHFFDSTYEEIGSALDITIPEYQPYSIDNYYDFLLNIINELLDDDEEKIKYYHNGIDYLEFLFSSNKFSIIVSMISYAIVVIRDEIQLSKSYLIQLISFILAASGNILVLVVSDDVSYSYASLFLKLGIFKECHIFRSSLSDFPLNDFTTYENIYFYIYLSLMYDQQKINFPNDNPFVQYFNLSVNFSEAFNPNSNITILSDFKDKGKSVQIPVCDKFLINKITITLYNSQMFDSDDISECFTTKEIAKYTKVIINSSDFMDWHGQRIGFYSLNNFREAKGYLDFNEIHYMKLDYHVKNPFYLVHIDFLTLLMIEEIISNVSSYTKLLNRIKSLSSNTGRYIEEKLLYAFHKIWKHFDGIVGYSSQIYAVNHAINYLTDHFANNSSDGHKGCIYQVKTGEGKSIIICALAEIFARMGKRVHIVTSNIVLACRDYEKSYNYFTSCKFTPSILLHQSEFDQIKCKDKSHYYPETNPKAFYHESAFNNPSTMNLRVFDKGYFKYHSEIIFSTFFNFEGWYLRANEEHPIQLQEYLEDCYLIIDESDTILIDELTNGTIIAREMKSNGAEILQKVFELYVDMKKEAPEILKEINKLWPECDDVKLENVVSMINDIKYALKFKKGEKYIIEKNKKGVNQIIPFDSEHKGITEREKEFSGFIHQFIGIKENRENKNLNVEIRPLSLNYMFISHPIFAKLYKGVWGFTGTVGTEKDKKILQQYYDLDTFEIPLHTISMRKDLPTIITSNIDERNDRILEETLHYYFFSNPVLVIFEQISEIEKFKEKLLEKVNESQILVFDGTNLDKSLIEENSGKRRMITLGTNFCGRGTDIEYEEDYPLHVIISYGPRNIRALGQAYGRTGRKGKPGTTRIICTRNAYHKICKVPNEKLIKKVLDEYDLKKEKQFKFIGQFSAVRPWIFNSNYIITRDFKDYEKDKLQNTVINVNRVTAINYQYPICMSVDTFHIIQLQKIYSLKNCPECYHTWILFQRYLRELVLESWSIFIDKFTRDYEIEIAKNESLRTDPDFYSDYFEKEYREFERKVYRILPVLTNLNIVDVFMTIHRMVDSTWTDTIMDTFPDEIRYFKDESEKQSFFAYKAGFYPFELKNKSGARVSFMYDDDDDDLNDDKAAKKKKKEKRKVRFIEDPELRYYMKEKKFSITYVIDIIFEKICSLIEDTLSQYLGIHFYVRRTLAGCEFGVCIDPIFQDIKIPKFHCLIDKNPLLLCAIICKSYKPFLAGILMVVLAVIAVIAVYIANYIVVPEFGIKDALKLIRKWILKIVKKKAKNWAQNIIAQIVQLKKKLVNIIKWLQKQIIKALHYNFDDPIYILMNSLLGMFKSNGFSNKSDLNDGITSFINIDPDVDELFKNLEPSVLITKIAILLVLLIAAFIKGFKSISEIKQSASSYQSEFTKNERWNDSNLPIFYLNTDEFEDYKSFKKVKKDFKKKHYITDITDDENS